MKTTTINNITKGDKVKKTLRKDDLFIHLSPKGLYGVAKISFGRVIPIDINRNVQGEISFENLAEAKRDISRFEEQQIRDGFENDNNIFDQKNPNDEYYLMFGNYNFEKRYYKD